MISGVKKESTAQQKAVSVARESEAFLLGDVEVLPASGLIRGPRGTRKLDPKVMAVLLRLTAAEGDVVTREALMADVWGSVVVTDFALSRCVYQLRKNLSSISGTGESPVNTLPKRGYSLTWPVAPSPEAKSGTRNGPSRWLAVAALVLGACGILLWQFWVPASSAGARPAIAVMPFQDLTADGSFGYFGDGIAQTLLAELGHVKELDVIARSSSFSLRAADMSPGEMAQALGVRYLATHANDDDRAQALVRQAEEWLTARRIAG